ncbi:MAG: AI-2E family transporter [Polyangiaceae bacterium]|nr:AI-2E family transporter [Polyangiaceae bacterium]
MELPIKLGRGTQALLLLGSAVIIALGLKSAAAVVTPLLFAALVAAATTPVVALLQRLRVPTPLAVAITVLLVLGALVGLGALVMLAGTDLSASLPRLEASLLKVQRQLASGLQSHGLARVATSLATLDARDLIGAVFTGLVLGMPGVLSGLAVVFFVSVFILMEAATFRSKLSRALGWDPDRFIDARRAIAEVQRYLFVKSATSAGTGFLCGVWCLAIGLDNAVMWGLVTFLLNYIPVVGSVVVTVLAGLAGLVELGVADGLLLLGGLAVINVLIGYLLEPRVLGRAVGLSPLIVIVSIVFWGWLLGPSGALLSVPLTMGVKIVLAHTEDLRWLAVLLGPGEGRHEHEYAEQQRLTRLTRRSDGPPTIKNSLPPTGPAHPD